MESEKSVSIFLAGPINGAESWRGQIVKEISNRFSNTLIDEEKPIKKHVLYHSTNNDSLDGCINIYNPQSIVSKEKFTQQKHDMQIQWETEHLYKANIIAFYIPIEEHKTENYAKTTRFELGEHFSRVQYLARIQNHFSKNNDISKCPSLIIFANDKFDGQYYFMKRINSTIDEYPFLNNKIFITDNHNDFITKLYSEIYLRMENL